jgi:hypothetical protein
MNIAKVRLWPLLGLITILLSGWLPSLAQAQRIEIEARYLRDTYRAVPMNENGLIVFSESKKKKGLWEFTCYDTELRTKWTKSIRLQNKLYYADYDTDGDILYVFFHKFKRDEIEVMAVNARTSETQSQVLYAVNKISDIDLMAFKGQIFLSGKIPAGLTSSNPIAMCYSLKTGQGKALQLSLKKNLVIANMRKDEDANLVHFTIGSYTTADEGLWVKSATPDGTIVNELQVQDPEVDMRSADVSVLGKNDYLVMGAYAVRKASSSSGLYWARFQNGKQLYFRRYNYSDLQNAFKHLSDRTQANLERRSERKKDAGKELDMSWVFLTHPVTNYNGQYTLLLESYYADYRIEYRTTGVRGLAQPVRVFNGYVYTHAIVAAIDDDGKLLWDNNIPLGNQRYMRLKRLIRPVNKDEEMTLANSNGTTIKSTTVQRNGTVVNEKADAPIPTEFVNDQVRTADVNEVSHWYHDQYVAWGYQQLRPKGVIIGQKRSVFYVAKIKF